MSRRIGTLAVVGALILVTADARAQGQAGNTVPDDRPATTTIMGDTGLWFVPAGEVLKDKQWSASAYFINWDVAQGSTDISHYAGTFAYGVKGRAEIFGAVRFDTRIDRDTRPIFNSTASGGIDNGYPLVHQGWIGNQFGDTFLGVKVNLASQAKQKRVAFAIRPMVKLPGSKTNGASSGQVDFGIDAIVSTELPNKKAEVSGTVGFKKVGDPDEVDLADSFTWGFGAQFPTRSNIRLTAEIFGEKYSKSSLTLNTPLTGEDGSIGSGSSELKSMATAMVGVTWQSQKGLFFGVGGNWSTLSEKVGDGNNFGGQVRIGYHPPIAATPIPAPPPPPTPVATPPEHTLTLQAQANPTSVEVGQTSQLTATAQDSIGCTITYRWSAPSGTFANPTQQNTAWTASNQTGTVQITVTGTCPSDQKSATATVSVNVTARPVQTFTFEDVYFDFDRFSLTDAAQRILSEAVTTLRANPGLRIRIEGHTCSIGTAEYNLALGDRRARSVMQYLISNGIAADRLTTVSFGEENPKYDNSREETRRLNRRAAMTMQIVAGN